RTIVFISHDLDEAMRIGDRIAIMKDGQVQQVGTPDDILRNPANDYVRTFIQGVDAAAVFKAGDIARRAITIVKESDQRGARAAMQLLHDEDRDFAYIVSPRQKYLGTVSTESLRNALHGHVGPLGLQHAYLDKVEPIATDALVADLFGQLAQAPCPLPVLREDGRFMGAISKNTLLRFLDRDTPPVPPTDPAVIAAQAEIAAAAEAANATTTNHNGSAA
ncbi:MAG: glycine betaine/L-proline ABC transporter ATP-binding protein, partial [Comamonas sp.]